MTDCQVYSKNLHYSHFKSEDFFLLLYVFLSSGNVDFNEKNGGWVKHQEQEWNMCQGRSSGFFWHLIRRAWLQKGVRIFQAKGPTYMTSLLLRMAQHSTMLKIIPIICQEEGGFLISASG